MSGIVAILNQDGRPVSQIEPGAMLQARPQRGPDGSRIEFAQHVAIGHQLFRLLPQEAGESQPLTLGDCLLAADVRLDNRRELLREMGLCRDEAAAISDAMLILLAYRLWGRHCPERLLGDFAFVVWNGETKELFAARDVMGARDLCYFYNERLFLFASEVSHILAHPDVYPEINDNRVAAFLGNLWDDPEETYYRNIKYLPPAHAMSVSIGRVEMWRYWNLQPRTIRFRDDHDYAEQYLELLTEAVSTRLRTNETVGISLSGGLDSTTLAALSAPILPNVNGQKRLLSFSYSFDELTTCDERQYIRPLVERLDLDATFIPSDTHWPLSNLADWPVMRDYVHYDPYIWLPISVMKAAEASGVRILLAGYFGDVLMTGMHYWALDMALARQFGLLGRTIRENFQAIHWKDSLIDFGLRRLIPPHAARTYRRIRPRKPQDAAPGLHEDLLARTDLSSRLTPSTSSLSIPSMPFNYPGFSQRYQTLMDSSMGQGMAISRHLYNGYGLELTLPYFDRRLVEYVLGIPAYILGRPGNYRRLHREAMSGRLPENVRLRPRRTSFEPLLQKGLRDMEKHTQRQILKKALIVDRGYIRADWLNEQLNREFDLSIESMQLWRCISLELWLQRYWN